MQNPEWLQGGFEIADWVFPSKYGLYWYIQFHEAVPKKLYQCDYSSETFLVRLLRWDYSNETTPLVFIKYDINVGQQSFVKLLW